jgi:hypothetical protein
MPFPRFPFGTLANAMTCAVTQTGDARRVGSRTDPMFRVFEDAVAVSISAVCEPPPESRSAEAVPSRGLTPASASIAARHEAPLHVGRVPEGASTRIRRGLGALHTRLEAAAPVARARRVTVRLALGTSPEGDRHRRERGCNPTHDRESTLVACLVPSPSTGPYGTQPRHHSITSSEISEGLTSQSDGNVNVAPRSVTTLVLQMGVFQMGGVQ